MAVEAVPRSADAPGLYEGRVCRGRPEAAALFSSTGDPIAREAGRARALRRAGVVRALVAAALVLAFGYFHHPVVAGIGASIGTLTLVLALFSPARGYAALSRAIDRLGEIVGRGLAFVLLAPVFFLFLTPFRWLLRRGDRDTLARGFDRPRASYWSAHERERDLEKPY